MTTTKLFLSAILALAALPAIPNAQAKETHDDERGDLEHYHHEFYSHSEVDPGAEEGQGTGAAYHAPHSQKERHGARPDVGVTLAFGGHRLQGHRHDHR